MDINKAIISDDSLVYRTPLMNAAKNGHPEVVKLLIDHPKLEVNKEDGRGNTALMLASAQGNSDVVQILLQNTLIDVNKRDNDGWTALCFAAYGGNLETVKLLKEHAKIDVNRGDNVFPLYMASEKGNLEMVKLLLSDPRIDVNKQTHLGGNSALSTACENGHSEVMKLLLSQPKINALQFYSWSGNLEEVAALMADPEIDVNRIDSNSETALSSASKVGRSETVRVLLGHPNIDVNREDNVGETPLFKASENGHSDTVKLLIDHFNINVNRGRTTDGETPLTISSKKKHSAVVELLLSHPSLDVNKARASNGATALWIASFKGHSELVNLLLNHKDTDVNKYTINRETPLMVASAGGHTSIVKSLLADAKMDANFATFEGKTAFWYVIDGSDLLSKSLNTIIAYPNATMEKQRETIELILRCPSTDLSLMDESFMTAKEFSVSKNRTDIVNATESRKFLLVEGHTCCSNKVNDGLQKAAEVGDLRMVKSFLLCSQVDLNMGYKYGRTPLFVASKNNHSDVVEALLTDARTDVNVVVNSGNALLGASENGNTEVVVLLLKHPGIDVNQINTRDMKTALIVASNEGHRDIVELLLRHTQIDVNKMDSFGETALEKASWKSYIRVVKLFLRCSETDVAQEYVSQLEESGRKDIVEVIRWWGTLSQIGATCCLNVDEDLLKAAAEGDFRSILGLLLCPESDINVDGRRGRTPLFLASLNGHIKALEALIENPNIDINKGEVVNGRTAFSIASEKGHFDNIRKLIYSDETDVNLGWIKDSWTNHIFIANPVISSTESTYKSTTQVPGK